MSKSGHWWIVREYRNTRHALSTSPPLRKERIEASSRKEALAKYREKHEVAPGHKLTAQSERR